MCKLDAGPSVFDDASILDAKWFGLAPQGVVKSRWQVLKVCLPGCGRNLPRECRYTPFLDNNLS